jgi:acetylornithine aminotransferase
MIGIELAYPCNDLVQQALETGLLINVTADTVIRLLPPLNFTREQAAMLVDTLAPLIVDFLATQTAAHPAAQSA